MSGAQVEPNLKRDQDKMVLNQYQKEWKIVDFKTSRIAREISVLKAKTEVLASECEVNNITLSALEKNCEAMEMNATTTFIKINKAKVVLEKRKYNIDKYTKYMEPELQTVPDTYFDEKSDLEDEMNEIMADIRRNSETINDLYLQIRNLNG